MPKLSFIYALILSGVLYSASLKNYQYISPTPGSDYNTRESTIIIRQGQLLDEVSLIEKDLIQVVGDKSGPMDGQLILSTDGKTMIFKPDQLFEPGEEVKVMIGKGLRFHDGRDVPSAEFSFKIAPFQNTLNPYEVIPELRPYRSLPTPKKSFIQADDSPGNFPALTATIYDLTDLSKIGEGYTFLAVAAEVEGVGYYLMVIDNYGSPVWYKELSDDYAYDFKVQPNGLMSYAHFLEHHSYTGGGDVTHMIMDTSFTLVDSVQMQNGYVAEGHDFQLLPNGHTLMFGYYLTQVDMSQYVEGGYPAAMVSGGIIQELDNARNVIFQWRSWDYYNFADYPWGRRSTGQTVSAFHLNTINLDNDGHILLATPTWVKKINRQTGEIMWHLGGDENEFSFSNIDSTTAVGHFGGHAFNRLQNNNVLIYDNGNRQGTSTSSVHEYSINEENLSATHVWTYEPDNPIYGWHRGNAQRLKNGNTVIGWGGATGQRIPAMTEVNAEGEKIFEISFEDSLVESYRAYRFPLPNKTKPIRVMITELADGNTYEFEEGDSLFTGVTVKINTTSPGGYNAMTVERWPYAPLYPQFPGKSPRVLPVRVYTSGGNINTINANIYFDAESFGFTDPDTLIIYQREFPGQGLFIPLATSYNPATGMLSAPMTRLGEFIFTIPDLEEAVYPPILSEPESQDSTVNQELPVSFYWSPRGLFNSSHLQVATDPDFTDLVVNDSGLTKTQYVMNEVDELTRYYWRVRIKNLAGTGGWSEDWFQTSAPMIDVSTPDGGEEWQRGLSYFIFWQDNLEEDVIIELFKGENSVGVIDTTESNGAYEWEIDFAVATGIDYYIKIQSLSTGMLSDMSSSSFSVIDTITSITENDFTRIKTYALHQNYPNPFNPTTIINYELPITNFVKLSIYNLLGKKVATLVNKNQAAGRYSVEWNAMGFSTGVYYYELDAGEYHQVKKMILIK